MAENKPSNYDILFNTTRELFLKCDQEIMIQNYHLKSDTAAIYFRTLNMDWILDRKTGVITSGGVQVDNNGAMAVYDILGHAADSPKSAGQWASLVKFGGNTAIGHIERLKSGTAYADFAGRLDVIEKILQQFGTVQEGKGDLNYRLSIFPDFDILFQIWDADEEFPVSVNYLFDNNADQFLHYETMWYVIDFVEKEIRRRM